MYGEAIACIHTYLFIYLKVEVQGNDLNALSCSSIHYWIVKSSQKVKYLSVTHGAHQSTFCNSANLTVISLANIKWLEHYTECLEVTSFSTLQDENECLPVVILKKYKAWGSDALDN